MRLWHWSYIHKAGPNHRSYTEVSLSPEREENFRSQLSYTLKPG